MFLFLLDSWLAGTDHFCPVYSSIIDAVFGCLLCSHIPHIVKYGPSPRGVLLTPFLAPVSVRQIDSIYGKYVLVSITFSHRPDEAISIRIS